MCTSANPKLCLVDGAVDKLRSITRLNPMMKGAAWPENIPFKKTTGLNADGKCYDEPLLCESDLAFLQYTSGSTGNPKGVMITFSNLISNVNWILKGHSGCMENAVQPDVQQRIGFRCVYIAY